MLIYRFGDVIVKSGFKQFLAVSGHSISRLGNKGNRPVLLPCFPDLLHKLYPIPWGGRLMSKSMIIEKFVFGDSFLIIFRVSSPLTADTTRPSDLVISVSTILIHHIIFNNKNVQIVQTSRFFLLIIVRRRGFFRMRSGRP